MFQVNKVSLKRPRTRLTNTGIFNALESDLVPHILEECNAIAVRATFSTESRDDIVLQITARRRAIEKKLLESPELRYFVCFISDYTMFYKPSCW